MTVRTRNSAAVDVALAVCGGIITATASLSALTALTDLHKAIPVALAVVAALTGATQVALRDYVQRRTVPASDVLEARSDDGTLVVAGPAADQATPGSVVRDYGDQPPRRAALD